MTTLLTSPTSIRPILSQLRRGAPVAPGDESKCVKPTLFANSVTAGDSSSFTISTIDNTCPEPLRRAAELRPFTREQILLQLKQYGEPTINQVPVLYTIAGHPAAITVASVSIPASPGRMAQTIYAAKACALGNVPAKTQKNSDPAEPVTHVVCIDFTTQDGGLPHRCFPLSSSSETLHSNRCSPAVLFVILSSRHDVEKIKFL